MPSCTARRISPFVISSQRQTIMSSSGCGNKRFQFTVSVIHAVSSSRKNLAFMAYSFGTFMVSRFVWSNAFALRTLTTSAFTDLIALSVQGNALVAFLRQGQELIRQRDFCGTALRNPRSRGRLPDRSRKPRTSRSRCTSTSGSTHRQGGDVVCRSGCSASGMHPDTGCTGCSGYTPSPDAHRLPWVTPGKALDLRHLATIPVFQTGSCEISIPIFGLLDQFPTHSLEQT